MDEKEYKLIHTRYYDYSLRYCFFWTTKGKIDAFADKKVQEALANELQKIASKKKITIDDCRIGKNYVLIYLSVDTKKSVSEIIKTLKGRSGSWLFKQYPKFKKIFPEGHIWERFYTVTTIGSMDAEYIKNFLNEEK